MTLIITAQTTTQLAFVGYNYTYIRYLPLNMKPAKWISLQRSVILEKSLPILWTFLMQFEFSLVELNDLSGALRKLSGGGSNALHLGGVPNCCTNNIRRHKEKESQIKKALA
jgi:hypothetical protein